MRPGADCAPKKVSGQCRHIRFACFTRGAFCVCSAREDSRSDNVQDRANGNPPVSAGLVLPPSSLVSACSSCLQTAAANESELSSHEVLPNRRPYLRSPRLTCQPSRRAKNLYGTRSKLTRGSPRHYRSGSVTPVVGETAMCETRSPGASYHCQDHRPTQSRRCNNPQNGAELPIAFGIAGPSMTIDVGIAMGSRCPASIWAYECCTLGKGAAGPGTRGPVAEHPMQEEHNRVRKTCFRTPIAFEGLFGPTMLCPLASKIYFSPRAIGSRRAPDPACGCSHYATALSECWEIPAWRRAIASTSPLSASLSSA